MTAPTYTTGRPANDDVDLIVAAPLRRISWARLLRAP
jgi:hypothetical protein